jgi:uncharacterized phiE125 gp8 family phage protein
MKTIIITPAAIEPVTLSEAKAQLRIDEVFTLDDDYIESLISAARERCESYCNQFFTAQGISLQFDLAPSGSIYIPFSGLTITSVTYIDDNNTTQTIAPSDYFFNPVTQHLEFITSFSGSSVSVQATTSAPAAFNGVKMAIKMIVTDLYELRTETAVGVSLADNPAVKALLYPFRKELGV